MVTGATGFLGHNLVRELIGLEDIKVIAILGRPEDKANDLPEDVKLQVYPCSELFTTDFGHIDTLIHTAFSRGDNLPGLTRSIEMTEHIIEMVNAQDIDSIINISSQGVYRGVKPGERVDENGIIEPNTAYGLAKWSVENMLKVGCQKSFTNIRMASLSANARFLDFFVDSVITGKEITITAPNQYASIMDVSDAVNGILSVVIIPSEKRDLVYNLGPGEQYSILDYANSANQIGQQYGFVPVQVSVDDCGNDFAICMDCSCINRQTGWKPVVTQKSMIQKMFNNKLSKK